MGDSVSPLVRFWAEVTLGGHAKCLGCRVWPHEEGRCYAVSGWLPLDAHHVVPKRVLKRHALVSEFEVEAVLADPRNGVPLRRWHHDRLERAMARLPREVLPEGWEAFVREVGLEWWADRFYPRSVAG